MDLVLISRSKEKLVKVSQEIKAATGVEIKLIALDFSHGVTAFDNIREELASIDVGILGENVCFFPRLASEFTPSTCLQ